MTAPPPGAGGQSGGGRLRIAVVGAGIVGVCSAAYLLRDGHEVVLLDPLGPGEGASKGNAGALSPGSCAPLAMPGAFRNIAQWLLDPSGPLVVRPWYFPRALPWLLRFALAARRGRVAAIADALRALHERTFEAYAPLVENARAGDLIRRSGCLVVYESANAFAESRPEWQLRLERGVDVRFLAADEVRQLEPALARHYTHGVLLPEHGFTVDPYRLVRALAERFVGDGGRLVKAAARGFRAAHGGAVSVLTAGAEIAADRVVIAAGVWSKALAQRLGSRIPLESQRGYHVTLGAPGVQPRLPVAAAEVKFYATPMADGLRVAGTVEFAGLAAPPDMARARRLLDQVKRLYPGVNTTQFTEWMGHRPCLPDSLPVIGWAPGHAHVLFAFGHGHNGMTSGPVTGRIAADLIAGRDPGLDLAPYRPERF